ncbi:unnamed protein product, partial [Meganyctiphanes norvegica]
KNTHVTTVTVHILLALVSCVCNVECSSNQHLLFVTLPPPTTDSTSSTNSKTAKELSEDNGYSEYTTVSGSWHTEGRSIIRTPSQMQNSGIEFLADDPEAASLIPELASQL